MRTPQNTLRNEVLRVFIGYDSREPLAFAVAQQSLLRHARHPVAIIPLVQPALRAAKLYTRERGATESTEFSMTRFLVPHLCDFTGHALFLDCDVLLRADVGELLLWAMSEPEKAVHVVQHEYVPRPGSKMEGQQQTAYPRKNWSSVMLFNNPRCRALTPEYVNDASGLELHRFAWIPDYQVGALPLEWNWLVGEYAPNPDAKLLHYTLGGPWFQEHRSCDHAVEWLAELNDMNHPAARAVPA